ncbi:MAG TPA: hypothetical protein VE035_13645 [Puia sp.]|nr:hypothetical protein [Puia sp.]
MSKNILARGKELRIAAPIHQTMDIVPKNPDRGTVAIVNSNGKLKEFPVSGKKRIADDVMTGIRKELGMREEYRNSGIEISEYECMYW